MTATIIPFPPRGTGRPGVESIPAGRGVDAAPALPLPLASSEAARAAERGVAPGPAEGRSRPLAGEWVGAGSLPTRAAYVGPCRRRRGPRSAEIPAASTGAGAAPVPVAEAGRLARALDGLRAALVQQAEAVTRWRASLDELEGTVGSLRIGLARQASAMEGLRARAAEATSAGAAAGSL